MVYIVTLLYRRKSIMGRKKIYENNSEKMKAYRENKKKKQEALKAEIAVLKASPALDFAINEAAIRESVKQELRKSWEPGLKAERVAAERKKGRELAQKADQNYAHGRISGICDCAAFFAGKDRPDLAQFLFSHFMVDRDMAVATLEMDKRTSSMTLKILDRTGAWKTPPAIIR